MRPAEGLLRQAYAVLLAGHSHSNRAACWIARAALESAVDDLLALRKREAPGATMRSKLTVLEVAYEQNPKVPALAQYAWDRLSNASHHHAFELSPAAAEVKHLIEIVRKLVIAAKGARVDVPIDW
ncbi:MAG TPA: hypothetical protein GXZ30_00600 [Propionibacterium sp.]|jgi:hypothetical protein|nr:hypothetical protein [Propionibacterium sp.]